MYPVLLRTKMIGFKPLRPIVPTSTAVSWCEPSPVKSTVRRDGSASRIPSAAPGAPAAEPPRAPGPPSDRAPEALAMPPGAAGEGERDDPRGGAAVLDDDLI